MRFIAVVLAWLLGCTHAGLISNGTQGVADQCTIEEPCYGGHGNSDTYVSIAIVSAIAGTFALALYRRITQSP